jgi:hypothetical protein
MAGRFFLSKNGRCVANYQGKYITEIMERIGQKGQTSGNKSSNDLGNGNGNVQKDGNKKISSF